MYLESQLTIHGFDTDLRRQMLEIARKNGISLNKAAIYLLRKGVDTTDSNAVLVK